MPYQTAGEGNETRPTRGSWSLFLAAQARWMLIVTLVVVAAASALVLLQTPRYVSVADVLVQAGANATIQPDMGTEASVAASADVLAIAARSLDIPQAELAHGLSVHEPGTTFLLRIGYSATSARVAQQRAQAVATAYVAYRSHQAAGAQSAAGTAGQQAAGPTTFSLITPASHPAAPSSPNKVLDIAAAVLVGLALALGSGWLRDHLDDRVRGAVDLEAQSGAPVLVRIRPIRPLSRHPGARLAVAANPESAVAQAYRDLRARLVRSARRNTMTLLVTSPAGEDRAEVAANLAVAFAQSGHSTVLVCADLRNNRIDKLFGLNRAVGFADGFAGLLAGHGDTAAVLQSSGVPGLRVLPAGEAPLDLAALLQGPGCLDVFSDLGRQAHVIVVEAPPLLGSVETGLLADHADRILLVADARRSNREQVRAGLQDLTHLRGKIAGWALCNAGKVCRLHKPAPIPVDPSPVDSGPGGLAAPAGGAQIGDAQIGDAQLADGRPEVVGQGAQH
jgi:Mrp family chromosome partitioning ATPase/capsular polysaccharide biosynthesis protein